MLSGLCTAAFLSVVHGVMALVSYIANNTFPQPLNEKEESHYLGMLAKGDEDARNVLTERNLRLVAHIVKKFDSTGEDVDDLISIGTIGLIKAINTFKPDKGTRLATYAARCIENEILMHLRFIKKVKAEVSLYDPIGVDKEGNEISLIDILGTDPEVVADTVEITFEKNRLLEKVRKLSNREKKVLEMRFGLGNSSRKTQREIARALGISRSYVSRIEKRALNKLVKELCMEGCQ
ncbi:RNA polymerase sporulation sigma factor SigK [Desulforamulus ferrireducens]|uniref:RNA polymerase sigma factor n=1 Tax=Desulforamulus ferrireducens TaxID=1833852 RepID=A0A1S6IUG2_9FIRM|nr:RNA polymerase sporulation sigma factor SigK [Desulforamulus ferrireducens]AQS58409.1 RNA polymerase subunit sigma-70 [Desulforamulus ferrireducens]AQS58467.1 RNA polymerase subunit sigma-70 [Desulforamulus ferrireducens]